MNHFVQIFFILLISKPLAEGIMARGYLQLFDSRKVPLGPIFNSPSVEPRAKGKKTKNGGNTQGWASCDIGFTSCSNCSQPTNVVWKKQAKLLTHQPNVIASVCIIKCHFHSTLRERVQTCVSKNDYV